MISTVIVVDVILFSFFFFFFSSYYCFSSFVRAFDNITIVVASLGSRICFCWYILEIFNFQKTYFKQELDYVCQKDSNLGKFEF